LSELSAFKKEFTAFVKIAKLLLTAELPLENKVFIKIINAISDWTSQHSSPYSSL